MTIINRMIFITYLAPQKFDMDNMCGLRKNLLGSYLKKKWSTTVGYNQCCPIFDFKKHHLLLALICFCFGWNLQLLVFWISKTLVLIIFTKNLELIRFRQGLVLHYAQSNQKKSLNNLLNLWTHSKIKIM